MDKSLLLAKANLLPQKSGCYLMKDALGVIIYIGKAKNLKNRVISYFNNSTKTKKTNKLVLRISDFDFILTNNEVESLVLENNLIKEHRPHYNIRLKDDKTYPYVQVNWGESFPRLEFSRRPKKGKNIELFGPFPQGTGIYQVIKILSKTYGFRDCSLSEFKSRKTPCLLYQMKQCLAPCVGLIESEKYEELLKFCLNFFKTKTSALKVIQDFESKMMLYAEKEEFELAKITRDNLFVLNSFLDKSFKQNVELLDSKASVDVWSYYSGEEYFDLSVYMVRNGMLLGNKNFFFLKEEILSEELDEIQVKILQYYQDSNDLVPRSVVVDLEDEELASLKEALKMVLIKKTQGRNSKFKNLIKMVREFSKESQRVRSEQNRNSLLGLIDLKNILKLEYRPKTIECFDIAIWNGQSPTAARIYLDEGVLDKTKYRYYHLKVREEGNNDFEMLKEVIQRRIKEKNLPDVFLIDGGKGQVSSVQDVLIKNDIDIPVIGIAKSKTFSSGMIDVFKSEERLVVNNNEIELKKYPNLFNIIIQMRDEAHRFSRKLHHKAEEKRVVKSWIEDIKGLSQKTKKRMLENITISKEEFKCKSKSSVIQEFSLTEKEFNRILKHFSDSDN